MTTGIPRNWFNLNYVDPRQVLVGLYRVSESYPLDELNYKVRSLRTRELRKVQENRQAALFAFGLGSALNVPIQYAHTEENDYDAIVRYQLASRVTYLPVQLKEWVPDFLNPNATLQNELDKLTKYVDSADLAVAVHLNRDATFKMLDLKLPLTTIGGLWFYGSLEPTQEKWFIAGNLIISGAHYHEFIYPTA
jgi:hypothetical protein